MMFFIMPEAGLYDLFGSSIRGLRSDGPSTAATISANRGAATSAGTCRLRRYMHFLCLRHQSVTVAATLALNGYG
jgi:hypothetical protein